MHHLVLLPYYCRDEVRRYRFIMKLLASHPKGQANFRFLLANAPTASPDADLIAQLQQLGDVDVLPCMRGGNHYWHGAATMFWEIMDHVHTHDNHDGGFVLWLESDMVPIRPNWLDRLDEEWRTIERPLVLGRLVTNFPDYLGGAPVPPHINGGACYAKDLAAVIPGPPGRGVPFDMAMLPAIASSGRGWRATDQFAFASPTEASALHEFSETTILHGLGPEKDEFVARLLTSLREQRA